MIILNSLNSIIFKNYLTIIFGFYILFSQALKANENIQELGRWLEMGVAVALHRHSKNGIEEALDLIDAYGENFLTEETGKGALILGNLLAALEEPAARFELWEEYKALINQLYPIS